MFQKKNHPEFYAKKPKWEATKSWTFFVKVHAVHNKIHLILIEVRAQGHHSWLVFLHTVHFFLWKIRIYLYIVAAVGGDAAVVAATAAAVVVVFFLGSIFYSYYYGD